jgi:GntR family transcriptional regulator, transcriptional repressor for pyruvate dehydrogenase complex
MTIQPRKAPVSRSATSLDSSPGAFRRIPPPRGLTRAVVDRIAADIREGRLEPGTRLPTEQEMIAALGVSRTVVREAIAALRAQGLVTTRQGVGAFVADGALGPPFRLETEGLRSITEVVHVMELRMGVEIEAAGLAAERAQQAQIAAMAAALEAIDRAIERNELGVMEDFGFHRAVADATGNPQFARFLEFLGRYIIPRQSVRLEAPGVRSYLETIQAEHRAIFEAIRVRSVGGARRAMRRHLLRSRARYRRLAASSRTAS